MIDAIQTIVDARVCRCHPIGGDGLPLPLGAGSNCNQQILLKQYIEYQMLLVVVAVVVVKQYIRPLNNKCSVEQHMYKQLFC